MAKILIIGGAGFVGSHLADVCLEKDNQVTVYDNFSVGRRDFLPDDHRLHIIEGDILDMQGLSEAMKDFNPELVFHLAAIHHIPTCEKHPEQALRVNVEGIQSVLSASARHNVTKVVFTSTGALYDPKQDGALNERSALRAQNVYAISKLAGEQLLAHYTQEHQRKAVVARLFNVVGRRETNPHVIPAILAQLHQGKRKVSLGNLAPRRDYVHVEDVAEGLYALGKMPSESEYDVFNIGSGIEHSVKDLVMYLSEIIGEPIEIVSDPSRRRKGDRLSQLANIDKIRRAVDWQPARTLQQALAEIWDDVLHGYVVAGR